MRHVVIVGGGFGGLTAARHLRRVPVARTLVDRANYHLFQPLLYQVAMSGLSPADIAIPIRSALHADKRTTVLLDEVTSIDLEKKWVCVKEGEPISWDYLVLAAGAGTNYFGHPEWSRFGLGLKDLDEAVEIRRRVLLAFEQAEREIDPEARRRLLHFVVIGGGPTGVEVAGALAELGRFVLARDFRKVRPEDVRVLLLEAAPRILPPFTPKLAKEAVEQLEELGVEVRTGAMVTNIDEEGVHLGEELLPASTVIWAAGVRPRPIARSLGVELDRAGRVMVGPDCSIPGHPEAFVIGDLAHMMGEDGKPLPGLAPVAMQQGRFVAETIARDLAGKKRKAFHYRDKGMMATIGRSRAVAQTRRLRMSGYVAWVSWIFVHLWFLAGFRNRVAVFFNWFWSYITYRRGARLITGRRLTAGVPKQLVEPSEVERAVLASRQAEEQPPVHH